MEPGFRVVTRRFGPTAHLALIGELDMDSGSVLQDTLVDLDEDVVVVVFDTHHLSFVDATGLNALLGLVARLPARPGPQKSSRPCTCMPSIREMRSRVF